MPDLETCLSALIALAGMDDARASDGIEEVVDGYLQGAAPDRAAQADALFRLIAAFIGRVPPTRVSESIIERLVAWRGELLSGEPVVTREREDATLRALIRRLSTQKATGAQVTPAQLKLILRALRFYVEAGPLT